MSLSRFACRCGLLIAALLSVVDPLCAQVAATRPVYRSMPAVECQVRDGLGNVMAKIEAGQPVRIAYLGGSITEMDGWRRLSREWLQAQYPACTFSETHAAIGGTGSSLGVYRVGEHVLKYDPDLVFVEFAVNDAVLAEFGSWSAGSESLSDVADVVSPGVVATGAVSVVKYVGRGSLRLLAGETERRRKGLVLVVR